MGPRGADEPGQARRPVPARHEHPLCRPARAASSYDRRGIVRQRRWVADERRPALCRCGPVPARRCRHHVPVVPRHPRRGPFHARAGQSADARCSRGGKATGLMAQRGGAGSPRAVPVLQGLCVGLPDPCRHGDLQVRVPVALLQGSPAAVRHVRHGPSPPGRRAPPPCPRRRQGS